MNTITFTHSNLNDERETTFYTPLGEVETKTQLLEIFQEEHYKKGRIKDDMTIIDCGANIGASCHYFAPYAKVIYALEPSRQLYEALVENTKNLPVKSFNIALGAKRMKDLLISNGRGDVPQSFFGNGQVKEVVMVYPLDEFVEEQGIEHIDLLKIDCEGAEFAIFPSEGFAKVAPKIDYIIGESHYIDKQFIPDFIPLILKDYGFQTEFLPITNYFLTMDYDAGYEKKYYKVEKQTLFFAHR